jgi:predicted nucleic acid-binding protein
VLQEFFVTITRKASQMSVSEARNLVSHLAGLRVVTIGTDHIMAAIDLHSRYQLSFWDSLIIVAAKAARASVVLSEDMGHMQVYDGVRVENPFVTH